MNVLQSVDGRASTRSASPTSPATRRVWVACYTGSVLVFDDR